ncbi:unnamed protein product [Prorocentrum cordatum]|uniref:Uncharacterized protein n=1 Tax=Prorocentrum cordatum TaxID=2364126 RepID=A0ABN9QCS9_9DINO|nr:unnamed protein product [Polarella glacialis]
MPDLAVDSVPSYVCSLHARVGRAPQTSAHRRGLSFGVRQVVLSEQPVLEAALSSDRCAPHLDKLATASQVDTASPLFPATVFTQEFGILDAAEAAGEAVRLELESMQYQVDEASPILESVRKVSEVIEELGLFPGLPRGSAEKLLLVSRVNAYGGEGKQVLLARGRLIAHSCRPNCVFVSSCLWQVLLTL